MKKILFIAALMLICIGGSAQEKQYKYCQLSTQRVGITKNLTVFVDFGKSLSVIVDPQTMEPRHFQSILEPINEMTEAGWELYDTYTMADEGTSYSRWIMRKEKDDSSDTPETLTFKTVDVKLMQNGYLVAF